MAIRKPTPPAPKSEAMAELLAGSMGQTETIKPGKIVDGTIKVVKGNDVFIDIGYKSEGRVDLSEFSDPADAKPGEKIQVLVRELENDKTGMVTLSKKAADIQIRWEKVLAQYTEGCVVSGTIQSQVHGGLLVDIDGVEAFLPGSQVDVSPVRDLTVYIGQTFEFKVIKISNERKNIIVSRRELIEGTMAEKRAELLASLQKGEVRKGRVKNITDFGAFIDLDGIDGLLHITDMSWGRIKHPSEMLKVGQELEVMVLDVDREKERISLGLKQTTEDRGEVPGRQPRDGQGREPRRLRRVRGDRPRHRGPRAHQRVQLDEARGASERHAQHRRRGARLRAAGRRGEPEDRAWHPSDAGGGRARSTVRPSA